MALVLVGSQYLNKGHFFRVNTCPLSGTVPILPKPSCCTLPLYSYVKCRTNYLYGTFYLYPTKSSLGWPMAMIVGNNKLWHKISFSKVRGQQRSKCDRQRDCGWVDTHSNKHNKHYKKFQKKFSDKIQKATKQIHIMYI